MKKQMISKSSNLFIMKHLRFISIIMFSCVWTITFGKAPIAKLIEVRIIPEHKDYLYKAGEKVQFNVAVLKCGMPLDNIEVRYEISEDMMEAHKTGTAQIKNGIARINAGSMKQEGFLRCQIFVNYQGYGYKGISTVGFSPEKLQPVTSLPKDFLTFWNTNKAEAEKYPLKPIMTLLPERCTDMVNVYHISFQNNGNNSRIYGILCIPKVPAKYPAILKLPGAGVSAYKGEIERASKGFIILEIGIHGIPVNMPGTIYQDLYKGALKDYYFMNLSDKDNYYYKRVYMGCMKAIDFIYSLPEFNGDLATFGGSQGGALSIITAGLDKRVKALAAFYPGLCDMAGYIHGRAGGCHQMFKDKERRTPENIETAQYYDVVNFARQIKVPGFYSFGYNDMTCPPTTIYSAYNVINAPKKLFIAENTGHYTYPEQMNSAWNWIMDYLKSQVQNTK